MKKLILLYLSFIVVACGFQIQKTNQKYPLIYGVETIELNKIINKTFQPIVEQALLVELKRQIHNHTSAQIIEGEQAELTLTVTIQNYKEEVTEKKNPEGLFYLFDFHLDVLFEIQHKSPLNEEDLTSDIERQNGNHQFVLTAVYQIESIYSIIKEFDRREVQNELAKRLTQKLLQQITEQF